MRITGSVRLEITIGPDGRVSRIKPVSGHALLVDAAMQAVNQWRYQPAIVGSQAVAVKTQVEIVFAPSPSP